ncbi:cytoplasmic dynein 2 heavy chain 1 [Neodiprion pinetum]|uniref:cytoplasmic dynein 2 heavy chain 1 n=1 Tax=Neodiprion pinetum TaxID=441929 RepID=UPI001EDDC31B|nr:cytoplasmic dynein 2 heavy chain 1 [Neodiprion pinetum]
MVKLDGGRSLIVSTASHYFGVPVDANPAIAGTPEIEKFLDEPSCRTLCAQPRESEDMGLKLTIELPSRGGNTLVFFKVKAAAVTDENFHDLVQVVTTGGNAKRAGSSNTGEGSALLSALRLVWGPTLQRAGVAGDLLKRLEEGLLGPRPATTVLEEQATWERRASGGKSSEERRVAIEATETLKRMRLELDRAAASRESLEAAEEALEAVAGYVDDLWKLEGSAYSEHRMRSLLDVIGNEIVSVAESLVNAQGIGAGDGPQARDEAVAVGASLCEKWMVSCERLTGLFWPHQSLHPWKGPVHTPQRCASLGKRLRLLTELRAQHRQLVRLLTPGERAALGADRLLRVFDEVQGLSADEDEAAWERAKRKVEESLGPAEERVAAKLRAQFSGVRGPAGLAAEFRRYGELLKREALRRALRGEREALLSAVSGLVESCQVGPDTVRLLDNPRILQDIQAARTAELRLEGLKNLVKELLTDLPGYEDAVMTITAALKEAASRRQELIESWTNEVRTAVISKELSLDADGAVVELTGASMMRVTYDPRLTQLVREVRALAGQGIELPREIGQLAERAGVLASRARALQQVATFHNTIGDRMVPSQRPLMLVAALELARAVREQSGVSWNDPHRVDAYTARLRELVRKFAQQNSELSEKHSALCERVASLLKGDAVNLATNQNGWKETLRNMRSTVDTVEGQYGNTKAWKLHWDRQLLKALGVAYRAALPSLLQKLPEIRVELVYHDGRLQWRPPIEEVRAKVYSALRRFLAIPTNFRGVGDAAEGQFGGLVRRSAYLFGRVYAEAEIVLAAMEATRVKWIPLAAPARMDPGERLKGRPPVEWEKAFKDAKQWAQEVGRLRGSEIRLWCIRVDTGTARADLESTTRRSWERLSVDLRTEASSRLVAVTEFLSSASQELDRRPRSIEEIGLAREAYARIRDDATGIAKELEDIAGLARVLAAWTRERLEGVNGARAAWEGLGDRLERHQTVITRQMEDAKLNLRHRYVALRDDRERWEVRWSSRSEAADVEWLVATRERWFALKAIKKGLDEECHRLGLSPVEIGVDDLQTGLDDSGLSASAEIEAELEALETNCKVQAEFMEELGKQEAEEWTIARRRLPRFQDWLDSWEARLRGPGAGLEQEPTRRVTFVEKKVREIRSAVEWAQHLRSDDLVDEHWAELSEILGLPAKRLQDVTLGHVLNAAPVINEKIDYVKMVTKRAAAEGGIRQALAELESWEGSASLPLQSPKDSQGVIVHTVVEYAGLLARAGELRLLLEGARSSSCYERFAARAVRWEAALSELEERVRILSAIQRKWIYLEPIFGGGAAPNEVAKWMRADREFRYLMADISRDPRVPALRRLPLPALVDLKDALDRCQRSLDEFLEEKRAAYPRLYFLSDEDLLELVSGGRGLEAHLPKLFPGLGGAVTDQHFLKAVISPEGEVIKLPKDIELTEPLPEWLAALEAGIRDALRLSLDECLADSSPDPSHYPAQILLLSERIRFTERCERAMREGITSLKNLVEALEAQRARYRGLEDIGDKLTALKARGLLLDVVHHLGVVRSLVNSIMTAPGSTTKISWDWSRQLRTYRGTAETGGPLIRCAGAEFPYRFEYQGASIGLVRTSLTERCFLALTQAMRLGLGGSPTGPAGTGKTESVKALGAILGRLVLVFNCDEGMDASSVRRILGGLAQAGAWGCFDEFNRLKEETLSAVSMLVGPLQEAVRDGAAQVMLGTDRVKLDPHCCIFITMNPAGAEYGGRHRLPDSLARLFRPVAMARPDQLDIAGSLLECAGFLEARTLAKQLVETLDLAHKLLSRQPHYDWGLRALRSVLEAVYRTSGKRSDAETTRLLEGLRIAIMPKLTESDSSKFAALLSDVFPNEKTTNSTSVQSLDNATELSTAVETICKASELGTDIAERCVQLDQQLQARTGVAIVGPPGCGKTLLRRTLVSAMARVGTPVTQFLVYPGAVAKTKLLGRVDPQTREWKEGLLSGNVASAGSTPTWIVLDGDVEPAWAEALNSALDDNRLLTLPNGVGVRLGTGTRFIFETHRLDGASPATVSRLGVVHLGSLPVKSLISPSRLENLPSQVQEVVLTHLSKSVEVALKTNRHRSSASGLIDGVMAHLGIGRTRTRAALSLVQSLCGEIEDPVSRDNLARFLYEICDCRCPDPKKPCAVTYDPERDRLEPLDDAVIHLDTDEGPLFLSGSVKIALAAVSPWIESGHPVLLRGSPGCGKSSTIAAALASTRDMRSGASVVRGSSLHGPEELVARLKRACIQVDASTANGRTYRPKSGRRLILLLENIHLASKDLQELVRQILQEGGFYEDDLEFAKLPVSAVCTADSVTPLHPRLEALLATHHMSQPRSKELLAIVELHLRSALRHNTGKKDAADTFVPRMATAMLEAVRGLASTETEWTARDLATWADALQFYPSPEDASEVVQHMVDAGRHLFSARLTQRERSRWESSVLSRFPDTKGAGDDIYAWKGDGDGAGLIPFALEQWREEVANAAVRCAREGQPVEAEMTSQFLQLVAGVSWALGKDQKGQGGLVLIGRPGAGRRTAVRLAAMLSSFNLINAASGRGRTAVKAAVQTAGIDGQPTLLLLEEHHLREEETAILIAALIDKGEIPGLVSSEELDGMLVPLGELARREDFTGSLEQYLQHRLKRLLRVAMIFDEGDTREEWILRSGVLRQCVLLGGDRWWTSKTVLTELAVRRCADGDEKQDSDVGIVVAAHLAVADPAQQTPASFLALLHSYETLKTQWMQNVEQEIASLEAGIGRLTEAGERVAKLQAEASKQREELEIEKGKAASALDQITATMRGATGQREEMTTLKAETERESAEVARRKGDIEAELGRVEPLVAEAAQAVAGISADALAEVRSLRAPPAPVRDVLEGVLRLMGIRDTSWNSMKTFLAKRGVKDELRTWDARQSSSASLDAVEKLVTEKPESFQEKTARRASVAAAPLATWVLANLRYGQVLRDVAPLEREQRVLAERLSTAEAQLGRLAAGLNTVEGRVGQLQLELAEHSRGVAALQLRAESTETSLAAAQGLLQGLGAEHRDWEEQHRHFTERKMRLSREAAGAATLLVYQSSGERRDEDKTSVDLLTTERERLSWRAQGLPVDSESLVGAVRALKGPLVPLFLDPSGVAVAWLKSNQASCGLEVTSPIDSRFLTTLELAVRFGKPLLVEEIDSLPSVILPLLRRGPLRLGDRVLAAQPGFKLFLATRRESVTRGEGLPREAVVAEVVLGAGIASLAERLVERALLRETPGLEEARRAALEREEKLAGERDAARIDLLAQLGAARGQDLLLGEQASGGGLLGSLEATQAKAKEIARALKDSRQSLEEVAKRAEQHAAFATFAAGLYEAVKDLPRLGPLYVFSAEEFTFIYLKALMPRDVDIVGSNIVGESRVDENRKKRLIALTLQHCTRAAYRKHRLALALHLVLALSGDVPIAEKNLLLSESATSSVGAAMTPEWVPDERKSAVAALIAVRPQLGSKLCPVWLADAGKIFADTTLTPLQKALVVRALRPDYLHTALSKLAASQLGVRDIAPPALSLGEGDWEDCPVLLLLSPGADPGPELRSLAVNAGTTFVEVSMGQGQLKQAELALEVACREGGWVLLSNLQLALNWLPRLESLLRSPACTTDRSPKTRVWLTTEECLAGFYPGLSALCAKLAYEPPEGVKRNVRRSLQQLYQERQEIGDPAESLLLAWLHATLQERRRFVPQGWIKAYEWSETDLEAAAKLVAGSAAKGDWEQGRGLLDAAVYGGRLQDAYDARALRAILADVWAGDLYSGRRDLGGVLPVFDASVQQDIKRILQAVARLPDQDPPSDYFGLPANADRAWERAAAESALLLLRGIAAKSEPIANGDSGPNVGTTSPDSVEKLLNELVKQRSSKENGIAEDKSHGETDQDPLNEFFDQERRAATKLLKGVQRVVQNKDFRSGDAKTPKEWLEEWPTGPIEAVPFAWKAIERHRFLCGEVTEIPDCLDLSWLGKPDAFFAALKQRTARRTGRPIEELLLRADWSESDVNQDEGSRCGATVEGLLLTGAVIRGGRLAEVGADEAPVLSAPRCRVSYWIGTSGEFGSTRHSHEWFVEVPVYADLRRNRLISALPVACDRENRDVWLRRGVALHLTASSVARS